MRYGFVLPRGDARTAAELAAEAESAGWDGFFVWEPVWGVDAWVALTAAAMVTGTIRLGTMLTPLPRRRPWELAGQTATLDNLSGGRVILSVGLGAIHDGWTAFETDPGRKVRAELLDEGLAVLAGLWGGQPFAHQGRHYTVSPTEFMLPAPPVQQARIPVWVVGGWPRPRSMRRAAQWDGWLPNFLPPASPATPDTLREGVDWLRRERAAQGQDMTGYEVIWEGQTSGDDPAAAAATVAPWAEAGATWWLEADWSLAGDAAAVTDACRRRLRAGPPRA
ncbi:MAG: LLM class flavin-dependent oxidoreductase [Micromonosporaceae bacterium]|nr:LLM class flavin-dependent oxidoreductase [Micromonosporaceae bacterium]